MKRNKLTASLALILIVILLLPAVASAATVKHAYSNGKLHLRTGPGSEYDSNGTVHNGDYISVISYGDVWSKVKTNSGKTGYIKNLYIKDGDTNYASGTSYFDSYTAYTTGNINFRSGASTGTASMGTLDKGTKVTVLGRNGDFYLVKSPSDKQGYISVNYISTKKPAGSSSSSSSSGYATKTVTASYVNMRAGGGLSYSVVRVLPYGTKVSVLYKGNYWTRVKYNGTTGWIKNTYLK